MEDGGFSLDCFVGERQNAILKKCSDSVRNTTDLEVSILQRCLADRLKALEDPLCFKDRLHASEPCPVLARQEGVRDAALAHSMRYRGMQMQAGDVVWFAGVVFLIGGCASLGDEYALLGDWLDFVAQVTSCASRWKMCRGRHIYLMRLTGDVKLSTAFYWESADTVVVLE